MTVSANSRRREYQGNGVTQVFNGPMAYARAHVSAFLAKGNTVTLVPSTSFDVEKLGYESGTRVTMHTPPAADEMLVLLRTMPYTQETDITNQGAFHAETIEKGFDALEMQIQQLADGQARSPALRDGDIDGSGVYQANGNRIGGLADGVQSGDAVTVGQLGNMLPVPDGFVQFGSGAILRTGRGKLAERVTPADFGAVGDGVNDDTAAFNAILAHAAKGRAVDLGGSDLTYRITAPLAIAAESPIMILASGARIFCDFPEHVQRAILINGLKSGNNYIGPLQIDVNNKANVGLRVISDAEVNAVITIDRPYIENVRRVDQTFTEGNGIFVTGSFQRVDILYPTIKNVTMAAGAGISGAQGINGISVRAGSGRPQLINITEPLIDFVACDDRAWTNDQDGILVWTDRSTSTVIRPTTVHINGGYFKNCLGRSIKCQVERAHIAGPDIYRDTGFTVASILPDIDLQIGGGRVTGVSAHYVGTEYKPQSLVLVNTPDEPGKLVPIGIVDGVQLTLTGFATLQQVVMCASRGRLNCVYRVNNISVAGAGLSYIARLVGNVDGGDFRLSICGADAPIGTAVVWANGPSPGSASGSVAMRDVINTSGTSVPSVTCNLSSFRPFVSVNDCYGLSQSKAAGLSNSMGAVSRVSAIAADGAEGGTIRPVSFTLADGATYKFPSSFMNANSGMIVVSIGASRNEQAIVACDSTQVVKLVGGSTIEVGSTTEPATGSYRMWTGTDGPSISNRSGASRAFTCFMIG